MAFIVRQFSYTSPRIISLKNFHLFSILQKSNIDEIDCFTTDLIRDKTLKWGKIQNNITRLEKNADLRRRNIPFNFIIKGVLNDIENIDSLHSIGLNIVTLSEHQLNSLVKATIKSKNEPDFYYIIKECLKNKILPDLNDTLPFLSLKSDVKNINQLEELYSEIHQKVCHRFLPFKGYALWKKGNVNLAIEVFTKFYISSEYKSSRKDIYRIFKLITNETFHEKGEAVLYSLINFSKELHTKFDDIFLLGYIWKKAFESYWFSDQNFSIEVFEENEELRNVVAKGSLKLCSNFLRENKTEPVYRLIELFLKYKLEEAYEECLKSLFDYYYEYQDVRACREIMNFLKVLHIPVSTAYNERLLSLLLKQNIGTVKSSIQDHQFQYKF